MTAVFSFLSEAQRILLLGGVVLIVIGAISPNKIYSVELNWLGNRATLAIMLGFILIAISLPVVQQLGVRDIKREDLEYLLKEMNEANRYSHKASLGDNIDPRGDARSGHEAARRAVDKLNELMKPNS